MAKITRGTTPLIQCIFPFELSSLTEVFLTIKQRGKVIIEKGIDEADENDKILTFRLTQEDTLKLDEKVPAEMQVRAKTNTGTAPASNVVEISVGKILKEGII